MYVEYHIIFVVTRSQKNRLSFEESTATVHRDYVIIIVVLSMLNLFQQDIR